MTKPLASGVLAGVLLLALVVGGLLDYCIQRDVRDDPPSPTPTIQVIVVPATEPPTATPTETPYAPFLFEVARTALPTATSTPQPTKTPTPEPTSTPAMTRVPVQKG